MGFSFKGVHSSSFKGLGVRTVKNEVMPEKKFIEIDSDYIDGVYDFTEIGGRARYKTRLFEKEIFITADNTKSLSNKIAEVVNWLSGSGELMLDECEGVTWNATVSNKIDFEPSFKRCGKAVVYFKADPFGKGEEVVIKTDNNKSYALISNEGLLAYPKIVVNIENSTYFEVILNECGVRCDTSGVNNFEIDYEKKTISNVSEISETKIRESVFKLNEMKMGQNYFLVMSDGDFNMNISYKPLFLWR